MDNYSKRTTIVREADLSDFSSIFVGKMCFLVSRPIEIETPKLVVDFLREKHIPKTIMEIVEDFIDISSTTTANHGNR